MKKKKDSEGKRKVSFECIQGVLPWEPCYKCEKEHLSCLLLESPSCAGSGRTPALISAKLYFPKELGMDEWFKYC